MLLSLWYLLPGPELTETDGDEPSQEKGDMVTSEHKTKSGMK